MREVPPLAAGCNSGGRGHEHAQHVATFVPKPVVIHWHGVGGVLCRKRCRPFMRGLRHI